MDAFRFILENPHPGACTNKQRKRARLVTACDSWYAPPRARWPAGPADPPPAVSRR